MGQDMGMWKDKWNKYSTVNLRYTVVINNHLSLSACDMPVTCIRLYPRHAVLRYCNVGNGSEVN